MHHAVACESPEPSRLASEATPWLPGNPARPCKGSVYQGLTHAHGAQGSQWWILPRAAVLHLVADPAVKHLWHYIKHTHIPDESFWHTALVCTRWALHPVHS